MACAAGPKTLAGVLINVEASDLTHVQAITVKADDGAERRFAVAPEAATGGHTVSPSHLRQHMTYGDRVVVHYRDEPGGALAIRVEDAP